MCDVANWSNAFELCGHVVFLDACIKNESMNIARMRNISFIVIDSNHQIIQASESFAYERYHKHFCYDIIHVKHSDQGSKFL